MTKKNFGTLALGLFVAGALTVGCSSKKAEVVETTPATNTVATTEGTNAPTVVASNTNLGASSSGYSR